MRNFLRWAAPIIIALAACSVSIAEARPFRLLVYGDSLSSGFMLPEQAGFPSVLSRRLHADGYSNVLVYNGSVAGETTTEAAQRLPSALEVAPDLVIVELGGNDMLDRTDPRTIYASLDYIVSICKQAGARVILAGMLALPSLGKAYVSTFDAIYPALARRHRVPLYPFFLQGVFGRPQLMMSDGKHPNELGVQRIVTGILPLVERNLGGARAVRRVASH